MQAVDEDIDLKQMRDMAAAKKRWDGLVLIITCLHIYLANFFIHILEL